MLPFCKPTALAINRSQPFSRGTCRPKCIRTLADDRLCGHEARKNVQFESDNVVLSTTTSLVFQARRADVMRTSAIDARRFGKPNEPARNDTHDFDERALSCNSIMVGIRKL
jgi:hypothetical protein